MSAVLQYYFLLFVVAAWKLLLYVKVNFKVSILLFMLTVELVVICLSLTHIKTCVSGHIIPCFPIESIMRLMTVWRITGKIIRTTVTLLYAVIVGSFFYNFRFRSFVCVLCFVKVRLSVKVKLFVLLLCVPYVQFCLERPFPK